MEKISIQVKPLKEENRKLPFYGKNGEGSLGSTNRYLTKNEKPWYPIMGEFHYSRYPRKDWLTEIYKMKSGGLEIIASYVIWIHHEETQGEWDFQGNNDLRSFIEDCQKAGVYFFLRIGPWAHGEVRNGGFPDWIENDDFETRTDDLIYLGYVKKYFEKVYEQCEGLLFKDGGPIIGLQIENEYGHAGGRNGEEGIRHMATLKRMLLEVGFDVPYYTATAWGGAVVLENETLPVFGGYVDAPWSYSPSELPANENFLVSPQFNDPMIASDFGISAEKFNFDVWNYPLATAELGGGLQVTKLRRPIANPEDTEAQTLVKIASGANLLGYYMYHGGTNPVGKLSTFQETTATGSHTDVPVLSYDFQAPLGEYGEFHESYRRLRKLHEFVQSFEDILTPSQPIFPKHIVMDAENTDDLRYCIRHNLEMDGGFLFTNNHQRHRKMRNHGRVKFTIELSNESIEMPGIEITDGLYGIFPYNIRIGGTIIKSSNASLLCRLGELLVFYHPKPEEAIIRLQGNEVNYIVISEEEANHGFLVDNKLYVTKGNQWREGQELYLVSHTDFEVKVYPENQIQQYTFDKANVSIERAELSRTSEAAEYELMISTELSGDTADVFLTIEYAGDRAELFREDRLVADWFTTGLDWRISLKRLNYPEQLKLKVYPTVDSVYYEKNLEKGCKLSSVSLQPIYQSKMKTINEGDQ